MRPPAYWWLLALAVLGQGGFLLWRGVSALRRGGAGPTRRGGEIPALAVSGLAGLAYGAVQSDPVFVVGQLCLFIIYFRLLRERNDG